MLITGEDFLTKGVRTMAKSFAWSLYILWQLIQRTKKLDKRSRRYWQREFPPKKLRLVSSFPYFVLVFRRLSFLHFTPFLWLTLISKLIIYIVSKWKSKFITYACVSECLHAFSTMFLHKGTQPRSNLASARSVQVCNGLTGMHCINYLGRTVILYF